MTTDDSDAESPGSDCDTETHPAIEAAQAAAEAARDGAARLPAGCASKPDALGVPATLESTADRDVRGAPQTPGGWGSSRSLA